MKSFMVEINGNRASECFSLEPNFIGEAIDLEGEFFHTVPLSASQMYRDYKRIIDFDRPPMNSASFNATRAARQSVRDIIPNLQGNIPLFIWLIWLSCMKGTLVLDEFLKNFRTEEETDDESENLYLSSDQTLQAHPGRFPESEFNTEGETSQQVCTCRDSSVLSREQSDNNEALGLDKLLKPSTTLPRACRGLTNKISGVV